MYIQYMYMSILVYHHMQGKTTECWLAETEGLFFLVTRALLVGNASDLTTVMSS